MYVSCEFSLLLLTNISLRVPVEIGGRGRLVPCTPFVSESHIPLPCLRLSDAACTTRHTGCMCTSVKGMCHTRCLCVSSPVFLPLSPCVLLLGVCQSLTFCLHSSFFCLYLSVHLHCLGLPGSLLFLSESIFVSVFISLRVLYLSPPIGLLDHFSLSLSSVLSF